MYEILLISALVLLSVIVIALEIRDWYLAKVEPLTETLYTNPDQSHFNTLKVGDIVWVWGIPMEDGRGFSNGAAHKVLAKVMDTGPLYMVICVDANMEDAQPRTFLAMNCFK